MTKVAAADELPSSNALHFGDGCGSSNVAATITLKRKTPSELRGELLKPKNLNELVDESPVSITGFARNTDGAAVSGPKRSDLSKAPRYIDAHVDELFPIRKSSIRLQMLSKKENIKEHVPIEHIGGQENPCVMNMDAKQQQPNLCVDDTCAPRGNNDRTDQTDKTGKCSNSTFRSVTQLSQGGENLNGLSLVDMDKALKGLVSCESLVGSVPRSESTDITGAIMQQSNSEFHVPGQKTLLDLTLKTTMRILSLSSVNWFHRVVNSGSSVSTAQFMCIGGSSGQAMPRSSETNSNSQVKHLGTLCSWMHPQSTLPHEVISALTISGTGGQADFLSQRQQAWKDSFRSLYYMLRKKICDIFYVCTAQFVVLFTGCSGSEGTKRSCCAYISRSTRYLRSLLKEQDVSFSMPLCKSKVEEITAEDLVELSEIKKYNLGETCPLEALVRVDNSPESLLMFTGNKNVHGLYDLILNYRSFLASLTGVDVPVMYSPVPFQNAALSAPEVRCKEVRKADHMSSQQKGTSIDGEANQGSSIGICYSVEIKDAYLPPWVISGACEAIQSNGTDFEVSFVTESSSIGLNVGLGVAIEKLDQQATVGILSQESIDAFGIGNATLSSQIRLAFLKGLKYHGADKPDEFKIEFEPAYCLFTSGSESFYVKLLILSNALSAVESFDLSEACQSENHELDAISVLSTE